MSPAVNCWFILGTVLSLRLFSKALVRTRSIEYGADGLNEPIRVRMSVREESGCIKEDFAMATVIAIRESLQDSIELCPFYLRAAFKPSILNPFSLDLPYWS